jgi:hypothetical protein
MKIGHEKLVADFADWFCPIFIGFSEFYLQRSL